MNAIRKLMLHSFLLFLMVTYTIPAASFEPETEGRVAVLKMNYKNFSNEEANTFEVAFLDSLIQTLTLSVLSESQVQLPSETVTDSEYFQVMQQQGLDFGIVVTAIKVGTLIDTKVELFSLSSVTKETLLRGIDAESYAGMGELVDEINGIIITQMPARSEGSNLWKYLVGGGAVIGGGIAVGILVSGGGGPGDLPAPDTLPDRP